MSLIPLCSPTGRSIPARCPRSGYSVRYPDRCFGCGSFGGFEFKNHISYINCHWAELQPTQSTLFDEAQGNT